MSSLKNKTPKKLRKIKKTKNMSNRKYKGKKRNKRFRTYRKKKRKNKIRNSTIKLKKNIKKMNASIIRVRKRILQKLKKQYSGGALGDKDKPKNDKNIWKCNKCGRQNITEDVFMREIQQANGKGRRCPGRVDLDHTASIPPVSHKVNYENYDLLESKIPASPDATKRGGVDTPALLLHSSPGGSRRRARLFTPPTPGDGVLPGDDVSPGDDVPPGDGVPSPLPGTKDPKDPKPLDETKEFGGKVSDAITKNPTETNPLLNPDREGKNRGQIYYHTGVTIESAATYTQGQVDKKLAEIENTVKDNLKRSDDDSDDSDEDSDSDDEDHDLASKKIVLTLIKSQPS